MADETCIAKNIKFLRESNQLTQADLGHLLGVSNQAVSLWERGQSLPRMGIIEKLSQHFHILKSVIIEGDAQAYLSQKDSPEVKNVFKLFNQLPNDQKRMVLEMIEVALRNYGLLDK